MAEPDGSLRCMAPCRLFDGVGGLADTVTDFQPDNPESTGFVFSDFSPWALDEHPRPRPGRL